MKHYTYIYHRGSDTFFALEDETFIFKSEELSEEALESAEEAGSLRGFEDEGYKVEENLIDLLRSSV